MLLFCSSTTALGNVLLGDLLPKFFAHMVLHLLDFLPSSAVMDGALLAVLSVVSLGVELVPVSELPPQAVRDSANVSASTSAVIFFIFCFFS